MLSLPRPLPVAAFIACAAAGIGLRADPFGGPVLKVTAPWSATAAGALRDSLHRDLAIQADGSVWVVDPSAPSVVAFSPDLTARQVLPLDAAIPVADTLNPARGIVGIAAVAGSARGDNLALMRDPVNRIGTVARQKDSIVLTGSFRDVTGLPAGTFLSGLDRSPDGTRLVTLDEAGRSAIILDADLRMVRSVKLIGDGNPLSGAGIAFLDGNRILAGASFGRPFRLDLLAAHDARTGLYSGTAVPLDALDGLLAGGIAIGRYPGGAGDPAAIVYDVVRDRLVAVGLREVPAPPPPVISAQKIGDGADRRFTFTVDPNFDIDEVVVRQDGATVGRVAPAATFDLLGVVGRSALEFEARSRGVPSPIAVAMTTIDGAWPAGDDPHLRFAAIPFNPAEPDYDPLDALAGLALDWKGTREDSRIYIGSLRTTTIRMLDGAGGPFGSFDHHGRPGTAGLAIGPRREADGKPHLMVLHSREATGGAGGPPRWSEIDVKGNVVAEGAIDVSVLAGDPATVNLGDWDSDGAGGYVAGDRPSGRICRIDGARMAVTAAVPAPPAYLGPAGGPPGPCGAVSVLPSGKVLLAGGPPGSPIASDLYLLTALGGPPDRPGGLFTGFSLGVPDLASFAIRFCDAPAPCPPSKIILPGEGFAAIRGLAAAYDASAGQELAFLLTPDAVLFGYSDGAGTRSSSIGTQGLLTRLGAPARPKRTGKQMADISVDLPAGGSAGTPALRLDLIPGRTDVFFAVLNTGSGSVHARIAIQMGGAGEPARLEEVVLPPGVSWRRRMPASAAEVALAVENREATPGTLRVVVGAVGEDAVFRRGDADATGVIDITDALTILVHLFLGGPLPPCPDAADADDSGALDLTDAVALLGYLFLGGGAPPDPGPLACGPDPTEDSLDPCTYAAACQ